MNNTAEEGPAIQLLHHRLTSCPKALQADTPPPHFIALIHDSLYNKNQQISASHLAPFSKNPVQCQWYRASALIAYFIADASFNRFTFESGRLLNLLKNTAQELSNAGSNKLYTQDVDRREEFIRVVLNGLQLRPQGETPNQAEDRLMAVSSQERLKVLKASKTAELRAKKIRTALAKQRAKEAADKMTRE